MAAIFGGLGGGEGGQAARQPFGGAAQIDRVVERGERVAPVREQLGAAGAEDAAVHRWPALRERGRAATLAASATATGGRAMAKDRMATMREARLAAEVMAWGSIVQGLVLELRERGVLDDAGTAAVFARARAALEVGLADPSIEPVLSSALKSLARVQRVVAAGPVMAAAKATKGSA